MQMLGRYLISLTAAAVISGILCSLFRPGPMQAILRLICGVFLAVTAIGPLGQISLPDWEELSLPVWQEAMEISAMGEAMAQQERFLRIKETLEAYILDKASEWGMDLSVEVLLDENGAPTAVYLTGEVPADRKDPLCRLLESELGIAKENQIWRGQNGNALAEDY